MHHKGFGLGGGGSEGQGDEEEDLDASVYQRVSKAVSEAYVGRWVGEMIERMDVGKGAVRDLFRLVSVLFYFTFLIFSWLLL